MDDNAGRDVYGRIKTGRPLKMVGMGEGELETEEEQEMRGGMEEERSEEHTSELQSQ